MTRPKPHKHHPLPDHARKVFHGERYEIYQWEQTLFDGSTKIYESIKRFDTVIVYPIVDDKVVIIEEEQPHWGKVSDSLVAGGIDDGEDIFDAARRELLEETGMTFQDWYLVHAEQKNIDMHSNIYIFIAKNRIETREKIDDAGERTHPKEVSFGELISLTRQRKFFHKPDFIDEFIIQDKIETLFDIFRNPEKYKI